MIATHIPLNNLGYREQKSDVHVDWSIIPRISAGLGQVWFFLALYVYCNAAAARDISRTVNMKRSGAQVEISLATTKKKRKYRQREDIILLHMLCNLLSLSYILGGGHIEKPCGSKAAKIKSSTDRRVRAWAHVRRTSIHGFMCLKHTEKPSSFLSWDGTIHSKIPDWENLVTCSSRGINQEGKISKSHGKACVWHLMTRDSIIEKKGYISPLWARVSHRISNLYW